MLGRVPMARLPLRRRRQGSLSVPGSAWTHNGVASLAPSSLPLIEVQPVGPSWNPLQPPPFRPLTPLRRSVGYRLGAAAQPGAADLLQNRFPELALLPQ